jgi:hypothetical protein
MRSYIRNRKTKPTGWLGAPCCLAKRCCKRNGQEISTAEIAEAYGVSESLVNFVSASLGFERSWLGARADAASVCAQSTL